MRTWQDWHGIDLSHLIFSLQDGGGGQGLACSAWGGPINAPATLGARYFAAASLHLYLASIGPVLANAILVSALKSSTGRRSGVDGHGDGLG